MSDGFLTGDKALAAIVLWSSGQFDTAAIAAVLKEREDAVYRTLHLSRDGARQDAGRQRPATPPAPAPHKGGGLR